VVVRIAEWGGVGDHKCGVALLPEGVMVGPGDAGEEARDGA